MKKLVLSSGLTFLALFSSSFAETLNWSPGGQYSGGNGNWQSGVGDVWYLEVPPSFVSWNNANNDTAKFEGAAGTVTVVGGVTANNLWFKNVGGYVLTGDTITATGGDLFSWESVSGTTTIDSDFAWTNANNTFIKLYGGSGPASLVFNGSLLYTGGGNTWMHINGEEADKTIIFNGAFGTNSHNVTIRTGQGSTASDGATYQFNAASSGLDSGDEFSVGKGNVLIGNGAALGSAAVNIGAGISATGTSSLKTTNATTISNNIVVDNGDAAGKYILGTTATGTTTFSGNVTTHRNLTIDAVAGSVVDFSGLMPNTGGSVTKEGAGTAIFSNATIYDYDGITTVNAGTLLVNNTNIPGTNTGNIVVNSGGAFGGSGFVRPLSGPGALTVNTGGTLFTGDGTTGTGLRVDGYLTMDDNAHITLTLGPGGATSYLEKIWGDPSIWSISDTIIFDLLGSPEVTTYQDIIRGNGLELLDISNWTVSNAGIDYEFVFDGGNVDLVINAVPEPSTWLFVTGAACLFVFGRRPVKGRRLAS